MKQKWGIVLALALLLGFSAPALAMLGDRDESREKLGSQFPPPGEEEEPGEIGGLWMNGCWESREPIEQNNPIFIPTISPNSWYEILPGVLDTEEGHKLAMLCNCRAMAKCDALLLTRMERRGEKRQRVITRVLDSTPDVPFRLIP